MSPVEDKKTTLYPGHFHADQPVVPSGEKKCKSGKHATYETQNGPVSYRDDLEASKKNKDAAKRFSELNKTASKTFTELKEALKTGEKAFVTKAKESFISDAEAYLPRFRMQVERSERYKDDIAQKHVADVRVGWTEDGIGYGVFANKDIAEGEMICEYTGKVRWTSAKGENNQGGENAYYMSYPIPVDKDNHRLKFFPFDYAGAWERRGNEWVIDARKGGNVARFINDRSPANAEAIGVFSPVDGKLHVIIVAKTKVKAGDEVAISYGGDYWFNSKV